MSQDSSTSSDTYQSLFDIFADAYGQSVWYKILWWYVALYGAIKILTVLVRFVKFQCKHRCRKLNKDLFAKYGNLQKGTYAVITGASDGIGLAYVKEFAKQGFNICMLVRNKDKMQKKVDEIKQ